MRGEKDKVTRGEEEKKEVGEMRRGREEKRMECDVKGGEEGSQMAYSEDVLLKTKRSRLKTRLEKGDVSRTQEPLP